MGDGVRWRGGSDRGVWRTGYCLVAVFGRVVECGRRMDGRRQVDIVRGRRKALPNFLVSIIFFKGAFHELFLYQLDLSASR